MKKKYFILIFIGLIAMITVSFILQNLYSEKTRYFGFAAGMFFIAVFALFSYKNALKPTEFISEKNSSYFIPQTVLQMLTNTTKETGAVMHTNMHLRSALMRLSNYKNS